MELSLNSLKKFVEKAWYVFPVIFFIYIGHALKRSHGHLRLKHLIFLTLGMIIIPLWHYLKGKDFVLKKRYLEVGAFLFLVFFGVESELIYNNEGVINSIIRVINFASIGIFATYFFTKKDILLFTIVSLYIVAHFLVPLVSPEPHIDVWVYAFKGANHLLNGINPYSQHYPDLYDGKYELTNGFCYWPTATYLFTVSQFFFKDVRWILVITHLLSLLGLYKFTKKFKERTVSALVLILWTTFPVSLFILEQSWVDGLIIPLIVFSIYFLREGRIFLAAILLGVMCMTKQYMIFYCVLTYFYVLKVFGLKISIIYTVVTAISAISIAGPFLIWDAEIFLQKSVFDLLKLGHREDALSWVSYFSRFYSFYIPGSVTGPLYILVTGLFSFLVYKNGTLQSLLVGLISTFLFVFLFGKQAFCNYYYLIALFILLYLVEFFKPQETFNEA